MVLLLWLSDFSLEFPDTNLCVAPMNKFSYSTVVFFLVLFCFFKRTSSKHFVDDLET